MLAALLENRSSFLSFLEKRLARREVAEDVLQEAFARSLEKVPLESEESAVAWFYRVLRNAVVDHYRRSGASERALASVKRRLDEHAEPGLDERNAVCRCVTRLSETLKPEYSSAVNPLRSSPKTTATSPRADSSRDAASRGVSKARSGRGRAVVPTESAHPLSAS